MRMQPFRQSSLHEPEQAPSHSFMQCAVHEVLQPFSQPPEQSLAHAAVQLPEQSPEQLPEQPSQSARAACGKIRPRPRTAMAGSTLPPVVKNLLRSNFCPDCFFILNSLRSCYFILPVQPSLQECWQEPSQLSEQMPVQVRAQPSAQLPPQSPLHCAVQAPEQVPSHPLSHMLLQLACAVSGTERPSPSTARPGMILALRKKSRRSTRRSPGFFVIGEYSLWRH